MNSISMAILASILMSMISLVGVIFFKVRKKVLKEELLAMVGLATGALLGDAFLHLIPEAVEMVNPNEVGMWAIGGIMIFFILEKFLKWRHCHDVDCHEESQLAWMSLAADSIHNLIDGLIIGSSFMVSIPLGIGTSLAVLMHEIPQEIGDLAILVHSGLTLKKATMMNFSSAFFSLLGVILVWIVGSKVNIYGQLMGLTAGGFVYLAASDLIPELHRHQSKNRDSFWQLITVTLGIAIMYFLI